MKKVVIKFNGSMEDLETILEYIGLSADTYEKLLMNAERFVDTKYPCFITISSDTPRGFVMCINGASETAYQGDFLNAEEILSDLRAEKRKIGIQDLLKTCDRYMGYCDLCPYKEACHQILTVYRECR